MGHDLGAEYEDKPIKFIKRFNKKFGKGFGLVDFKVKDFGSFVLVGGTSSTHPGKPLNKARLKVLEKRKGEELAEYVGFFKKSFKTRKKRYEETFRKAKKKGKPIIFLTHNCPYQTKLDKIGRGPQKGKHYGSYLEKKIIKRYRPELVLCGHMHENFGKDNIYGNTWVVNSGSAMQNQFVVIDFDEKKRKVKKVRFIK